MKARKQRKPASLYVAARYVLWMGCLWGYHKDHTRISNAGLARRGVA